MGGELLLMPKGLAYSLHLRGDREQTRAVIVSEAEGAEMEALEWST